MKKTILLLAFMLPITVSKTTVLFSVRNVCFTFDESGNPICNNSDSMANNSTSRVDPGTYSANQPTGAGVAVSSCPVQNPVSQSGNVSNQTTGGEVPGEYTGPAI